MEHIQQSHGKRSLNSKSLSQRHLNISKHKNRDSNQNDICQYIKSANSILNWSLKQLDNDKPSGIVSPFQDKSMGLATRIAKYFPGSQIPSTLRSNQLRPKMRFGCYFSAIVSGLGVRSTISRETGRRLGRFQRNTPTDRSEAVQSILYTSYLLVLAQRRL